MRHQLHALVHQALHDLKNLPETASQPGQFADKQPITPVERVDQLEEVLLLRRALGRGVRFHKVVDRKALGTGVVEDRELLVIQVLSSSGDPQIGNGLHMHSRKRSRRLILA